MLLVQQKCGHVCALACSALCSKIMHTCVPQLTTKANVVCLNVCAPCGMASSEARQLLCKPGANSQHDVMHVHMHTINPVPDMHSCGGRWAAPSCASVRPT